MKFVSLYFCCPFHPTSISLCCERLTYIVHYWPDLKGKSCYSLMDALLVGPQLKFKLVKAIFSFNYLFVRQESPAVAGERPPGFFLSGMNIWNGTIRCSVQPPDAACHASLWLSSLISLLAPVFIYLSSPSFFSITSCKLSLHLHCRPSLGLRV